jgi:hypothetical protein
MTCANTPEPKVEVDPSIPVHLTRAGVLKDGQLNRDRFAKSVEQAAGLLS